MNNFEIVLRLVLAVAGIWFIYVGLRDVAAVTGVLNRDWKAKNDRFISFTAWVFIMLLYGAVTLFGVACVFAGCYTI